MMPCVLDAQPACGLGSGSKPLAKQQLHVKCSNSIVALMRPRAHGLASPVLCITPFGVPVDPEVYLSQQHMAVITS